jgi:hypothetical protein
MVDADMESVGLKSVGEGFRILKEKFGAWHQWSTSVSANLQAENGSAIP